jgi:hypothetical protein
MSTCPRPCKSYRTHTLISCNGHAPLQPSGSLRDADLLRRFVESEKWRKETKLDETVPTWEYPEKEELFKYYPQYYHKTDKVYFKIPGAGNAMRALDWNY